MTQSKMMEGIKVALELIEDGKYIIDREEGVMHNAKTLKQIGSLDKPSGNIFYVIKGVDILAHRLHFAYYHGYDALLDETKIVKHLDGDKANNSEANLVMVNRKGWKAEIQALREENGVEAPEGTTTTKTAEKSEATDEVSDAELTDKEKEAVAIWNLLLEGKTTKEVAEELNITTSRVYDVKRGKSNRRVTETLPALPEVQ